MIDWLKERYVKQQIEKLKDLVLPDFLADENPNSSDEYAKIVRDEIMKIIKVPLQLTQQVFNDSGQSFAFYRCRRKDEIKNLNLICEYNYPPLAFSKKMQRANLPYHPVFYSSNHALTTIKETLQHGFTKGERLMISRWVMRDTHPFYIAPLLFHGLKKSHPWYTRIEHIKKYEIKKALQGKTTDEYNGALQILNALSKEFFKSKDYKISASMAHSYLYSDDPYMRCDVLIYPSVCTDGRSVNFAIHPNFVDNRIFMEEIYVVEIGEYCKLTSFIKHRLLFHGKVFNSEIKWLGMEKSNPMFDEIEKLYKMRFQ